MNPSDALVRPPFPDESARVAAILKSAPPLPGASLLALVRERPVERIAAVLAWRADAGELRFVIANAGPAAACWPPLLDRLAELAAENGAGKCVFGAPVGRAEPAFALLENAGFRIGGTDRNFHLPAAGAHRRVAALYDKIRDRIPPGWRVTDLADADPVAISALVLPHALMNPTQFQRAWSGGGPERIDERLSGAIYDNAGLLACMLASRRGADIFVEAECCRPADRPARMLANVLLIKHLFAAAGEDFAGFYLFKADESAHRQTANTALRLGGEELPPAHRMVREISSR